MNADIVKAGRDVFWYTSVYLMLSLSYYYRTCSKKRHSHLARYEMAA